MAWHVWGICNKAGRDGCSGCLRIESVISTLTALDGSAEDMDKVVAIEAIAEKHRETDGDRDGE